MLFISWKELVCGWGSACTNITIMFPIYKIIFRQMLSGINTFTAIQQLHNEGLHYLYRGMLPPMMQKTLAITVMFGGYEEVRLNLMQHNFNTYVAKATAGIVAGSVEASFMPFERVQTLLVHANYNAHFRNTFEAFKHIGYTYGAREYYRGLTPILLRNGPSNAIFFIARDEIYKILPPSENLITRSFNEFLSGAVIGACSSSLLFPLNVLKVGMQSKIGGPMWSIFKTARDIYIQRGRKIRHFYHGALVNCLRAFLSWGIMNSSHETMRKLLY